MNIPAAMEGRVWELLPEGFRSEESARTYPVPNLLRDLQRLAAVPISPDKRTEVANAGNIYLKRCLAEWKRRQARRTSAVLDLMGTQQTVKNLAKDFEKQVEHAKAEAARAVDGVRQQAEQAIASLNDLFALGRKGIEAQMRAHLDGADWQGERIKAAAFRDCFRMVTQAVKGLGLPSGERAKAAEAIMEEAAASIRATQEAVALGPGSDDETQH